MEISMVVELLTTNKLTLKISQIRFMILCTENKEVYLMISLSVLLLSVLNASPHKIAKMDIRQVAKFLAFSQ